VNPHAGCKSWPHGVLCAPSLHCKILPRPFSCVCCGTGIVCRTENTDWQAPLPLTQPVPGVFTNKKQVPEDQHRQLKDSILDNPRRRGEGEYRDVPPCNSWASFWASGKDGARLCAIRPEDLASRQLKQENLFLVSRENDLLSVQGGKWVGNVCLPMGPVPCREIPITHPPLSDSMWTVLGDGLAFVWEG